MNGREGGDIRKRAADTSGTKKVKEEMLDSEGGEYKWRYSLVHLGHIQHGLPNAGRYRGPISLRDFSGGEERREVRMLHS